MAARPCREDLGQSTHWDLQLVLPALRPLREAMRRLLRSTPRQAREAHLLSPVSAGFELLQDLRRAADSVAALLAREGLGRHAAALDKRPRGHLHSLV